jgi:hypothetical protein
MDSTFKEFLLSLLRYHRNGVLLDVSLFGGGVFCSGLGSIIEVPNIEGFRLTPVVGTDLVISFREFEVGRIEYRDEREMFIGTPPIEHWLITSARKGVGRNTLQIQARSG